jgi:hypothetical protein
MSDIATINDTAIDKADIVGRLVLKGDLSGLRPDEQIMYYKATCERLGLDPLSKPFELLKLNGKQILYATKACTDQLRVKHGVSVTDLVPQAVGDIYIVTAKGQNAQGRTDAATGAVTIVGLKGDALANAMMKAETKAKRRLTLSLCGLGMIDESEIETIPGAQTETLALPGNGGPKAPGTVDPHPAEVLTAAKEARALASPKAPQDTDDPAAERKRLEEEIGKYAGTVGGDTLTAAREQLTTLREMVKTGGIEWDEYMGKLNALKTELGEKALEKGLF